MIFYVYMVAKDKGARESEKKRDLFKVSSDKRSRYRVGVVVGVDIICQEITQLASQLCSPTDLTN